MPRKIRLNHSNFSETTNVLEQTWYFYIQYMFISILDIIESLKYFWGDLLVVPIAQYANQLSDSVVFSDDR